MPAAMFPGSTTDTPPSLGGSDHFLCRLLGQKRGDNRVLVYAPSKRLVFEVNEATWDFLRSVSGRNISFISTSSPSRSQFLGKLFQHGFIDNYPSNNEEIKPAFNPTRLILLPTADCNLRCAYCFSAGGTDTTTISQHVAKAAVDLVIGLIDGNGERHFSLSFCGGGEPTSSWDLVRETWKYAYDVCNAKTLRFDAVLTTNGTWGRPTGEWIAQHISRVTVSLDGTANVMALHRPSRNGKNVFETVVQNISFLIDRGCKVGIRSTVSAQSVSDMPAALELFHSLGVRKVHFEPLAKVGRAHQSGIMPPSQSAFVEAIWSARLRGRDLGMRVTSSIARFDGTNRRCSVAAKAVCVTPNGRLTSCHRSADDSGFIGKHFHYGNYDPTTQHFVIDLPLLDSMLADLASTPECCKECIANVQCTAGCYYNNLVVSGRRMAQDSEWCNSSRELTCRLLEEELRLRAQTGKGNT
ncbi:MAG: radical SAM protein [Acidobacteriaceae bacterium]|jgi:uncharacterized protein